MKYARHADADLRLASARLLADTIARVPAYEAHKRELLHICLWKVTEAEGAKYNVRFRSVQALNAPADQLEHDHVVQRSRLVDRMLAEPHRAGEIALEAVGCVVTDHEHQRLTALSHQRPDLDGWARYAAAEIRVIDSTTGEELPYAGGALGSSSTTLPTTSQ